MTTAARQRDRVSRFFAAIRTSLQCLLLVGDFTMVPPHESSNIGKFIEATDDP
jgi:hypothetical protein